MGDDVDDFAVLLRAHRTRRRLTQEALAELAGISSRSVGEMERGNGRSPRPGTLEHLATALELSGEEREEFVSAGRALFWASRARPTGSSAPRRAPAGAADPPPWTLPADLSDFVGRGDELALLGEALDPASHRARLAVISGPPGVGKTALAVHAGHRFAARFPDGHLYAALRCVTGDPAKPLDVMAHLLRLLGLDGSALPTDVDACAGLLRARLAGRRILLILDDATGYHQVEPMLPPEGVAVVVTSRMPLTGLPGVTAMDLRPLPDPVAVELLCQVAGAERVRAEPSAAADLVAACGGLPLALRITGARLAARPHWMLGTLTERLADERRRLDELRHGDLAVRPGLQLTYRGLTPAAARAFALLGALSVPSFPEWPVAALLDVGPAQGAAALEELLDARLLEDLGLDQAGQSRYRFHDVTRLYAQERREAEFDQTAWRDALARAATGWLALARHAQDHLDCERFHLDDRSGHPATVADERAVAVATGRPVEWFEAEREALAVLVSACAEAGLAHAARGLAGCGADFYELRAYYGDWRRAMESGLAACRRAGDRPGEAAMLRGLGGCLVELDDLEAAVSTLRAARALAKEMGDPAGAAMARKDIGFVLSLSGRLNEAELDLRDAAEELGRAGRKPTKVMALTSLGFVQRQQGDLAGAVATIRDALRVARSCGDRFAHAFALRGLAGALVACGQAREAELTARQAAALFARIGDRIGAAQSLRVLGEALAQEDSRLAEAEQTLAAAAAVFREGGHAWGLALTELSLGEIEVRRGSTEAAGRLRRSLEFWTEEQVPALRARALVSLASAAEQAGDPAARGLLTEAYGLYQELGSPAAAELAARLGLPESAASPA
ncbi:helix-turn-helix domain-containing protein [Nonomuraea sp. NPDC048916]|uniref:ATP-binding protein n=1 Tax=Nonomuraea sp. NPDC048916 TaxID=3154232 RepID=UPI0033DECFCE